MDQISIVRIVKKIRRATLQQWRLRDESCFVFLPFRVSAAVDRGLSHTLQLSSRTACFLEFAADSSPPERPGLYIHKNFIKMMTKRIKLTIRDISIVLSPKFIIIIIIMCLTRHDDRISVNICHEKSRKNSTDI